MADYCILFIFNDLFFRFQTNLSPVTFQRYNAFISTNTTFLVVDEKDLEETCMQTDLYDDLKGVGSLPTRFSLAW